MRLTRYFLPVLKETPAEAQIASHRLMLRAGHDPPGQRRDLFLAAHGLQGAAQHRAHRARGTGPRRSHRHADADDPVGGSLARERPVRRLRRGDAPHHRPPQTRHALRSDQRGADHRHLPVVGLVLQGPAAHALPHPVEIPRRGPSPVRRDARPRVPDEGRLQFRPYERRRAARLQPPHGQLHPHLRAHGTQGDPDARRFRTDRRRRHPRVPRSRPHRRERRLLRSGRHGPDPGRPRHRLFRPGGRRRHLRRMDRALRPHRRDPRRRRLRDRSRKIDASRAGASRSARSSISARNTPIRSKPRSWTATASAFPSTWARTASA